MAISDNEEKVCFHGFKASSDSPPTANAQYLSFVMLSEAVGEVETSKNEILRLR